MSQRTSEKKVFLRKGSGKPATPRPVGQEARVPKPAPKSKAPPKPTPPTYEEQDQEDGSQDSEVEELEDAITDDEEPAVVAPPAKLASSSRSKTTSRTKAPTIKSKSEASTSIPAHMKMMASILDHKSSPGKSIGITEHPVSFDKLIEINEHVTRILLSKKEVRKANPGYNAVFSRTALCLCGYLVILQAREASSSISDEEHKVLKRIRASIPFNQIIVPAPYILALQGLGFHIPADKKFDRVVPTLPAISDFIHQSTNAKSPYPVYITNNAVSLLYPSIPHLFALMSLVVDENVDFTVDSTLKNYAGTPADVIIKKHLKKGSLVPFHREVDYGISFTFLGATNNSTPTATSYTSWLALNAALLRPIPARPKDINEVSDHIPSFPGANWKTGVKISTLMDFFHAGKSLEWMNRAFEALAYESKFFDGASTLESIGFSRGSEALAPVVVNLDSMWMTFTGLDWFEDTPYEDEPFSVSSKREATTETDLQIALYQKTIVTHTAGPHNYHRSSIDCATGPVFTEGYLRRRIKDVPDYRASLHLTIETELLKDISTVL